MSVFHQETTDRDFGRGQHEKDGVKGQIKREMLHHLSSGSNGASLLGPNPDISDESVDFATDLYVEHCWPEKGEDGDALIGSVLDAVREFINKNFQGTQEQKDGRFSAATHLFRIKLLTRLSRRAGNQSRNPYLSSADDTPPGYN